MPQRHILAPTGDLPPGAGKAFTVAGQRIALFNLGGRFFAIDDTCTHDGASLAEGTLAGTAVVCPWHSAEFDVTTGEVLCPPACENVRTHPVFVNGGSVEIES
jgi:3-phenylpropionate/trans-cinnamate dioxygenase ferredoxin component